MIDEAHRFHPSIVVLGLALLGGFVAIVVGTILSVGSSKSESPELGDLALPVSVDVIDSHATCDASACDGFGLAVDRDGMDVAGMEQAIAERLRLDGWSDESACPASVICLERDDLRVEILPWSNLDESVAPTMRDSLTESGVDQTRLVYLSYYRCGVLRACA